MSTAVSSVLVLFGWSAIVLGQDVNLPYVGTGDGASSSNLVLQSAPAGTIEVRPNCLRIVTQLLPGLMLPRAHLLALSHTLLRSRPNLVATHLY